MDRYPGKITVYLNPQQHRELKSLCAQIDMTMSCFASIAIQDKIRREIEKIRINQNQGDREDD